MVSYGKGSIIANNLELQGITFEIQPKKSYSQKQTQKISLSTEFQTELFFRSGNWVSLIRTQKSFKLG